MVGSWYLFIVLLSEDLVFLAVCMLLFFGIMGPLVLKITWTFILQVLYKVLGSSHISTDVIKSRMPQEFANIRYQESYRDPNLKTIKRLPW